MSLYDYERSKYIATQGEPFYALIMTAMRQADDQNIESLKHVFPEVWEELNTRYHAPGGLLPSERKEQ